MDQTTRALMRIIANAQSEKDNALRNAAHNASLLDAAMTRVRQSELQVKELQDQLHHAASTTLEFQQRQEQQRQEKASADETSNLVLRDIVDQMTTMHEQLRHLSDLRDALENANLEIRAKDSRIQNLENKMAGTEETLKELMERHTNLLAAQENLHRERQDLQHLLEQEKRQYDDLQKKQSEVLRQQESFLQQQQLSALFGEAGASRSGEEPPISQDEIRSLSGEDVRALMKVLDILNGRPRTAGALVRIVSRSFPANSRSASARRGSANGRTDDSTRAVNGGDERLSELCRVDDARDSHQNANDNNNNSSNNGGGAVFSNSQHLGSIHPSSRLNVGDGGQREGLQGTGRLIQTNHHGGGGSNRSIGSQDLGATLPWGPLLHPVDADAMSSRSIDFSRRDEGFDFGQPLSAFGHFPASNNHTGRGNIAMMVDRGDNSGMGARSVSNNSAAGGGGGDSNRMLDSESEPRFRASYSDLEAVRHTTATDGGGAQSEFGGDFQSEDTDRIKSAHTASLMLAKAADAFTAGLREMAPAPVSETARGMLVSTKTGIIVPPGEDPASFLAYPSTTSTTPGSTGRGGTIVGNYSSATNLQQSKVVYYRSFPTDPSYYNHYYSHQQLPTILSDGSLSSPGRLISSTVLPSANANDIIISRSRDINSNFDGGNEATATSPTSSPPQQATRLTIDSTRGQTLIPPYYATRPVSYTAVPSARLSSRVISSDSVAENSKLIISNSANHNASDNSNNNSGDRFSPSRLSPATLASQHGNVSMRNGAATLSPAALPSDRTPVAVFEFRSTLRSTTESEELKAE